MSLHDTPAITVIVPSYNHVNFIENALDSIANEDYLNKQIVVVDDGSTDGSAQKIFNFLNDKKENDIENIPLIQGFYKNTKTKLNLIACNNNKNPSSAKNIAIKAFLKTTDAFCFLDSDDLNINNKIKECSYILCKSWGTVGCVYNDYIIRDFELKTDTYVYNQPFDIVKPSENLNIVSNSLIPKYVFDEIGFFNEEFDVYENNEFSIKLINSYLCYHIPKILNIVNYGSHCFKNNISKFLLFKSNNKLKELIDAN